MSGWSMSARAAASAYGLQPEAHMGRLRVPAQQVGTATAPDAKGEPGSTAPVS